MNFKETALSLLQKWIDLVQDYSKWVLLTTAALTIFATYYAANNLGMNMDTRDMLSDELLWRQLDLEYEKNFPQFTDNITVVVEAKTPDQASDAALLLYNELIKETDLFKSVFYLKALPILKKSALLFQDIEDLQDLSDSLADIQPFLSRLTEDQTLRGLFSMLNEIVDALEDDVEVDVSPLLSQLNLAIIAVTNQLPYRVSWQELMSGEESEDPVSREFIILQPVLDYSNLMPATDSIGKIHELADRLQLQQDTGAAIRLTGSVAIEHESFLSVSRGIEIAMIVSFCAVSMIMLFGLGSLRLVAATLITLVTGLIMTAAFAAFAVGDLNMISIAFSVLYIGLGVDFAIHYCLRYRELRIQGLGNHQAIDETSFNIGRSMFLCALTTAIGFFAFIPTDYDGVAELGLISGTGMFISLIVTLSLLPALLKLVPLPESTGKVSVRLKRQSRILLLPFSYAPVIRIAAVIITVLMAGLLTQMKFDHNTLNLEDPNNESVKTFKDLLTQSSTSPWTSTLLVNGQEEAEKQASLLESLPLVDDVVWLNDFIPQNQDEKLYLVEEMALLLGDLPEHADKPAITTEERRSALESYVDKLDTMGTEKISPDFRRFSNTIKNYLEHLASMDENNAAMELQHLENNMLASLPGRIDALRESLMAEYVSKDDLPYELADRWHNGEDTYLLQIYPRENIYDNGALRRFVEQVQNAEPRVIGSPVTSIEASDSIVEAFQQAFLYSFIVIIIFLLFLLDYKIDTLFILGPLLMAAICTCATTVLFDMPFNFANVIALPLLLGIGVDSGIHIMHRFRTAMPEDSNLLATSSARAVVVSALTSVCSIGSLAFSSHVGMASMGKLLTIGIAVTLIFMLIVLPSLLAKKHGNNQAGS